MTRHSKPAAVGRVRRRTTVTLAAIVGLALAGCTGDGEDAAEPDPATASSSPPRTAAAPALDRPDAVMRVSIVQVSGRIVPRRRPLVARDVSVALESWVEGGFGGQYPRADFDAGFASWTKPAADLGRRDRAITTNAALGPGLVDIVAERLSARLYIFAVGNAPGGATADVAFRWLGERDTGDLVRVTVRGDVRLTRSGDDEWRIFGYDLRRTVEAAR